MTTQPLHVIMPQLGANDDEAQVVEWLVKAGAKVNKGQQLVVLETSKATFELECEENGYFWPVANEGVTRAVQDVIGLILSEPDEKTIREEIKRLNLSQNSEEKASASYPGALKLTIKARQLLEKHKIDPSSLPTDRIIRTADIQPLIKDQQFIVAGPAPDALRRAVIYGASQGGLAAAYCLRCMGDYEVVAFLDDTPELIGSIFSGYPVWPGRDIVHCIDRNIGVLITHIANRDFRIELINLATTAGLYLVNVIHPSAMIADSVCMGVGNLIKAGAIIDTEVTIGDCCIIDNGAIVPHHVRLGNAVHLAPGVSMGGDCVVGDRTLIGVGATISSRITIGNNVIVSPGSTVVRNVPANVVLSGNPGKIVGRRS